MVYGYCTGFSTDPHFKLGLNLLPFIHKTGFDYVEFPLMNFHGMDEGAILEVETLLNRNSLAATVACNFLPASIKLVGKDADSGRIAAYLDDVLPKLKMLGTEKIIFGSGPARSFGPDQTLEEATDQFAGLLKDVILPRTKNQGMLVCIEPFQRGYSNLIITAKEGLEFVEYVNDEGLELMVDLYHMMSNEEPLEFIKDGISHIKHVHVAGGDRRVPEIKEDGYIFNGLRLLAELGYDGTVSFETELPKTDDFMVDIFKEVRHCLE